MKFSEFYGDVRTYFVSCTVEYDRFRLCDGIKQKLVFLLKNKKVQGSAKRQASGCVNTAGKAMQKW